MIPLGMWRINDFDEDDWERDTSNTPLSDGEPGEFGMRVFPIVFVPLDAHVGGLIDVLYWAKAYSPIEVVEDGIVVELRMKPEHMKEVITILDSIGGYTLRRKQTDEEN